MTEKKLKYAFGTSDTHCEADFFDTIEEVIEYAQASWDDKDGNPFDEDCDYSVCSIVGRYSRPDDRQVLQRLQHRRLPGRDLQ